VKDLIEYKWTEYARNIQWFGWILHIIYQIVLGYYVETVYLSEPVFNDKGVRQEPEVNTYVIVALSVLLVYPVFYDGTQMVKSGWSYFQEPWNWLDILHVFLGYGNIYCQFVLKPLGLFTKLTNIAIIFTSLLK